MAKVNSKSKGNTFERKISNYLSDRFNEYTGNEKSFTRNTNSGSFFGGKNKGRIETYSEELHNFGDILAPEAFRWSIECKHYKDAPSLNTILRHKSAKFDEWIDQAEQDAENCEKHPLVIIKFNNIDVFVLDREFIRISILKFTYKDYYAYTLDEFFNYYPNDGDYFNDD